MTVEQAGCSVEDMDSTENREYIRSAFLFLTGRSCPQQFVTKLLGSPDALSGLPGGGAGNTGKSPVVGRSFMSKHWECC